MNFSSSNLLLDTFDQIFSSAHAS